MAERPLKRLKLPIDIVRKLSAKQIATAKDLFRRNELQLLELLDLNLDDVQELLRVVSVAIVPSPRTAFDLLKESKVVNLSIAEEIPALHLTPGITELVGAAGAGKTQVCMMLCAAAALPASPEHPIAAVYIDTEGSFSPSRLIEIAQSKFPESFPSVQSLKDLSTNVIVYAEASTPKLLDRVNQLEEVIIERSVKLVVVDSVAAPVRTEFNVEQMPQRQKFLGAIASKLKFLGEKFKIPIVVTNQVTTKRKEGADGFSESYLSAALGVSWAHAVNTRFILLDVDGKRQIKVGKSPRHAIASYNFEITRAGLEILSTEKDKGLRQGSVIDIRIPRTVHSGYNR